MGAREIKRSAHNVQKQLQVQRENTFSLAEHIVIKDLLYIKCWQHCGQKNRYCLHGIYCLLVYYMIV